MSFFAILKFKLFSNSAYKSAILKVDQCFKKRISQAGTSMEQNNLKAERSNELYSLYDEWESGKTLKLIAMAIKYDLLIHPKPAGVEENEYWRWSSFGHILTASGRFELRKLIQQKRNLFQEKITFYSVILFGLLGLIIGLLGVVR